VEDQPLSEPDGRRTTVSVYREKFVIVGGAVPWLLLPDARPPHIGTLDLDLDLDLEALAGAGYAAMKGYAHAGRDKKKDAYDIYFSVAR